MSLSSSGRYREAEAAIRRGMDLEPLSPLIAHAWVMNAILSRRYREARERALESIAINPAFFLLHLWLGLAYLFEERFSEAIQAIEKAVTLSAGRISWVLGSLGHAHATAGNRTEALRLARELLDKSERETIDGTALVLIYVGLGDSGAGGNPADEPHTVKRLIDETLDQGQNHHPRQSQMLYS